MVDLPKTVEEAVSHLMGVLSKDDLEVIKDCAHRDLIQFCHSLGAQIRNDHGLWNESSELKKDTLKSHADDASMVIIKALWKELQKDRVNGNRTLFLVGSVK